MIRAEQWDNNIGELVLTQLSACTRNCAMCLLLGNPVKCYYQPHLTDVEPEAQRSHRPCPRATELVPGRASHLGSSDSRVLLVTARQQGRLDTSENSKGGMGILGKEKVRKKRDPIQRVLSIGDLVENKFRAPSHRV